MAAPRGFQTVAQAFTVNRLIGRCLRVLQWRPATAVRTVPASVPREIFTWTRRNERSTCWALAMNRKCAAFSDAM